MKYYVQISNGRPEGFLISEENLMQLALSPNQLIGHPTFREVTRTIKPQFNPEDHKVVSNTPWYELNESGVVIEGWDVRDMTTEEIAEQEERNKEYTLSILNHLIQQGTETKNRNDLTSEQQNFITHYLEELNTLLNKPVLTFDEVVEMKVDFHTMF